MSGSADTGAREPQRDSVSAANTAAREKPQGWPARCAACGASWEHIGFDYADGFNCQACGRCDSDE